MTRFTLVRFLQTYAVLIMILILMLALSLASDSFLSAQNLLNILNVDLAAQVAHGQAVGGQPVGCTEHGWPPGGGPNGNIWLE